MMKTFIAVVLVTNTFPIMMGIFDVAQSVISDAAGVIITDTAIGVETLDALRESLLEMDIGSLLRLYLQSFLMGIIMWALTVCIFIIVCVGIYLPSLRREHWQRASSRHINSFEWQGRKGDFMAYVPIPKDLSNVKTKVMLNLTKRIISIHYWKGNIN